MSYTPDELLSLASSFEEFVSEKLVKVAKEKKLDPKAQVRARGKVVFPAESSKVTDHKDHFPINNAAQARNALARVNQFSKAPDWYKGSLQSLVDAVVRAVKKHYPSIDISDAAKKPGKNSKKSNTLMQGLYTEASKVRKPMSKLEQLEHQLRDAQRIGDGEYAKELENEIQKLIKSKI